MKFKTIFFIIVFIAGYIFVSFLTYKPNRQGMTGKERTPELTETFTHFFDKHGRFIP